MFGIYRGSEHAVVMRALTGRPGVLAVEANPVAQTATVTYDQDVISVRELRAGRGLWLPLRRALGPLRRL